MPPGESLGPEHQLARILHLVPLASRDGGATYEELASAVHVQRDQLLRDLEALTAREFYHPAGTGDEIQVGLEGERVRVWTTGPLQRPVRLDLREAAALHLGLRLLADERDEPTLLEAMRRVEERLVWPRPGEDDEADGAGDIGEEVVAGDPLARDAIRATVVDAARRHRRVELYYLKSDSGAPQRRVLAPYVIAHAGGHSYAIGHTDVDSHGDAIRVFRFDRVLQARVLEESYTVPDGFDPADYMADGRVYRAEDKIEVTVRYSPRVARWITEAGQGEAREDGCVQVAHSVADPGWLVRHVLRYGPEAEVLGPPEAREWMREALDQAAPPDLAGASAR